MFTSAFICLFHFVHHIITPDEEDFWDKQTKNNHGKTYKIFFNSYFDESVQKPLFR